MNITPERLKILLYNAIIMIQEQSCDGEQEIEQYQIMQELGMTDNEWKEIMKDIN